MTPEQLKELKAKARDLPAFMSIGKNGISENTLEQIRKHLKANKLTKVKLLRTFLDETGKDKKEVAKDLANQTNSELIQLIGLTVILYKR